MFKVGMLVLCHFFLSTDNVQVQEGQESLKPREVVGTIIGIQDVKKYKEGKHKGKTYGIEEHHQILEVEGQDPGIHFFIKPTACAPIKTQDEISKELEEDRKIEQAAIAKEKKAEEKRRLIRKKKEKERKDKADKEFAELAIKKEQDLIEFEKRDALPKTIDTISVPEPSTRIEFKNEIEEEKTKPVILEEAPPRVERIEQKEEKKEDKPKTPEVKEASTKAKAEQKEEKGSVVKDFVKDMFNGISK